jgi:hypothetical protein
MSLAAAGAPGAAWRRLRLGLDGAPDAARPPLPDPPGFDPAAAAPPRAAAAAATDAPAARAATLAALAKRQEALYALAQSPAKQVGIACFVMTLFST